MKKVSIESILDILNTTLENVKISKENVNDDLSQLGMDSIKLIRVIVSLEEEFNLEVPDEYLLLSEMNTINKIILVLSSITID